ncbi:methyltransferase [Aestuariivirga litoralis]|uniref:Methyltransferase n=1 Tax=Aestuariivirga litoralis TaxID=2650924 RepID=A0A2W2ANJ1_9HYPH|nr:trimethylamine methyltransferase family protein [Aestuariivirga litoralis]PZF75142.1 methyltransferase [Aestuariivirga litoralis]
MRPDKPHRRRRAADIVQMPWQQLVNPLPPTPLISEDEVEAIHRAALQLLETVGVRCAFGEARALLAHAGASVDEADQRIRIGRDIVEEALKTVRAEIRLTPRNPERAVRLGGRHLTTAAVLGPPNCTDLVRGRRSGSLADLGELLKLTQAFNIVQMNGWPVEPLDVEVRFRHLAATRAMLTLTDKVPYVFCQSRQRIEDVLTMCAIARGETLEEFGDRPGVFSIINTNTPLTYDVPMTVGVMDMARHGQPVLLTPFIMAGASTPATIAGAMALNTAEVLFGVVLSQLVRPGAPVLYGCAAMNVDMKTGAPAYGLADMQRCTLIGGQMARRYRMPMRSSNFSSANIPDFASGYESANACFAAAAAGAHLLMHAAGWVEGGLCTSYEKFVLDCEIVQSLAQTLVPPRIDADTLALTEIAEVGPGGHFFGTPRTISTFETAFYRPLVSATQNYGAWLEAGGKSAAERATAIWQEALNHYAEPDIDPSTVEALDAFVARRTEQGGAPLD